MKTVKYGLYYSEVLNSVEVPLEIHNKDIITDEDVESIAQSVYDSLNSDQIVALDMETAEHNADCADMPEVLPKLSSREFLSYLVSEALETGEFTL